MYLLLVHEARKRGRRCTFCWYMRLGREREKVYLLLVHEARKRGRRCTFFWYMRLGREREKVYLLLVQDMYSGPQTVAVITRRDNSLQNTVSV